MGGILDWFGSDVEVPKAEDLTKADTQVRQDAQDRNLKLNNIDQFGPGGSAQYQRDASGNIIGMTRSLDPSLGWGAGMANQGLLMSQLPGTSIDWNSRGLLPGQIAQRNFDAYAAMTSPQRQQQFDQMKVMMADRGLPINSEVSQDLLGNWQRQNSIADTNAAAQAWNATPGMESMLTNTALTQANHPFQQAGLNMGLLSQMQQFAPQNQFQGNMMNAADASGNMKWQYDAEQQAEQQKWANMMGLAGGVATLGMTPFLPGGGSMFGAGAGALGLGGGGGGGGLYGNGFGTGAGNSWNAGISFGPTVSPQSFYNQYNAAKPGISPGHGQGLFGGVGNTGNPY
jgi:hypothetical protein